MVIRRTVVIFPAHVQNQLLDSIHSFIPMPHRWTRNIVLVTRQTTTNPFIFFSFNTVSHSQRIQRICTHLHFIPDGNHWKCSTRWMSDTASANPMASLKRLTFPRNSSLYQRVNLVVTTRLGELSPLDMKYTCVHILRDCCKMKTEEGMDKALAILHRLLDEKKKKNNDLFQQQTQQGLPNQQPRLISIPRYVFHTCMYGFAQLASKNKMAIDQSQRLLHRMWDEYRYDTEQLKKWTRAFGASSISEPLHMSSCRPTVHDYNTLLTTLAYGTKWGPRNIPKEAETIVNKTMMDISRQYPDIHPDATSYNLVIQCYANSGTYDAGQSAQAILDTMQQRSIHPNLKSYTSVICAFANSNGYQAGIKAQQVLFDFVRKNKNLGSTTSSPNTCPKDDPPNPDTESSSTDTIEVLEPDHILFTSCIQAWVNGAKNYKRNPKVRFEAAQHAEDILRIMYELAAQWDMDHSPQDNASSTQPTKNPYLPDRITWNTVLTGWAKSDTEEAAPRAQKLLDEMLELSKNSTETTSSIVPDRFSFHIVMDAWARYAKYDPDSALKAENILTQMYDLYHSGRFSDTIKPDATSYIVVMKAWARSESPNKVQKCRKLLETMMGKFQSGEEELKPNIVAFTTILNAIVHTPSNKSSLRMDDNPMISMALQTYREIMNDPYDFGLKPDKVFMESMLEVLKIHVDKRDDTHRLHVDQILDDAYRCGIVL